MTSKTRKQIFAKMYIHLLFKELGTVGILYLKEPSDILETNATL